MGSFIRGFCQFRRSFTVWKRLLNPNDYFPLTAPFFYFLHKGSVDFYQNEEFWERLNSRFPLSKID
jgi:hypothetical protein